MSLGYTKISYLDRLYHPTTGCSFDCKTCWARALVCNRLSGTMKGLPIQESLDDDYEQTMIRVDAKVAGRLLDGVRHDTLPWRSES